MFENIAETFDRMKHPLALLLVIGLAIRLIIAPLFTFNIDMGYWSNVIDVFQNGFGLYGTAGYYYTPIWGYYLGFVSGFMQLFGIVDYGQYVDQLSYLVNEGFCVSSYVTSIQFNFLVKFPLIICDVFVGLMIYKFINDRTGSRNKALLGFALWFFCPLIITESAAHGTFDNLSVMFLLIAILLMMDRKYFLAGASFVTACLTKFFPAFMIFFMIAYVLRKEGLDKNGAKQLAIAVAGGIAAFVLIYLPNIIKGDLWQSMYFIAYRLGITRETLASIGTVKSVILVAVFLAIISAAIFLIARFGPAFKEKMDSLEENARNRRTAKILAYAAGIVAVAVLALIVKGIIKDGLDFNTLGNKFVVIICVFSIFLEIYLAFRLLMLKEMDDIKIATIMFLSALAIILWPSAPSYIVIAIPFMCIYFAMIEGRYLKHFAVYSILITLGEITAYMLSPTSLLVALGIGVTPLIPMFNYLADPMFIINGAGVVTNIFSIPAYILLLYFSYRWYNKRRKEGTLWQS